MNKNEEILSELLKLPTHERARLAIELVQSLDGPKDTDADDAWLDEIERRAMEVRAGAVEPESWPAVRNRVEARY